MMAEPRTPKETVTIGRGVHSVLQFAEHCASSGVAGLAMLSRAIALMHHGRMGPTSGSTARSSAASGNTKISIPSAGKQVENARPADPDGPRRKQETLHMAAPLTRKSAAERPLIRRKHERFTLSESVWVSCRGSAKSAMLVDFSAGGLRLDGTFGLMPGDQINVRLSSGEELAGSVVWSLGAMVGVAFPTDRSEAQYHCLMARIRPAK
jgi:hypothetical protein